MNDEWMLRIDISVFVYFMNYASSRISFKLVIHDFEKMFIPLQVCDNKINRLIFSYSNHLQMLHFLSVDSLVEIEFVSLLRT